MQWCKTRDHFLLFFVNSVMLDLHWLLPHPPSCQFVFRPESPWAAPRPRICPAPLRLSLGSTGRGRSLVRPWSCVSEVNYCSRETPPPNTWVSCASECVAATPWEPYLPRGIAGFPCLPTTPNAGASLSLMNHLFLILFYYLLSAVQSCFLW